MNKVDKLTVLYHGRRVGQMALVQNRIAAFEYDKDWLSDGFSISPFSLPLEKKVFMPKLDPFEGLFGVFADSLPDGWGRLLVDRLLRKKNMDPAVVGVLIRLAIVAIMVAIDAVEVPMARYCVSFVASRAGFVGTIISQPGVGRSPLPIWFTVPFMCTI